MQEGANVVWEWSVGWHPHTYLRVWPDSFLSVCSALAYRLLVEDGEFHRSVAAEAVLVQCGENRGVTGVLRGPARGGSDGAINRLEMINA